MRQERPYHSDSTASRLLSEVKHCRARFQLQPRPSLLYFCSDRCGSKRSGEVFGPGNFDQYADSTCNDFDGGDSETGLVGDGQSGLRQFGYDVSPHLASTMAARYSSAYEEVETAQRTGMSYTEEMMHSNPSMDEIRAVQLQNWATQQEIASANRYMNEKTQVYYEADDEYADYGATYLDHLPIEEISVEEETTDCLVTLVAPLNGVASHEIA
eukprot:scaffold1115_cov94-Skeletonema_dohrnii-CCMP3373.AAC.1